jgi:hypothetical protein
MYHKNMVNNLGEAKMKKMPTITIKHSSEMKKTDVNSQNKRYEKLRASWLMCGQTEAQVNAMFPIATLEQFTSKPGFYGKFSGGRGGEWRGPYKTKEEAQDVVGEIAYESTYS